MFSAIIGAAAPAIMKGIVTGLDIDVLEMMEKAGKALGKATRAWIDQMRAKSEEERKQEQAPAEVVEEVQKCYKELIHEYSNIVYIDGVNLICDYPLSEENQKLVRAIMVHCNYDEFAEEELIEWEEKEDIDNQKIVDFFVEEYMDANVNMVEEDCIIGESMVSLNFNLEAVDDYLYDEKDIRLLAKALNDLLGERIFTSVVPFDRSLIK